MNFRYQRGLVREDGLKVSVKSTMLHTFASPEAVAWAYDQGKVGLGLFQATRPSEIGYTEVRISK